MPEAGFAVEVNVDPQGSELDQAALAADTVLILGDASEHDPGEVVEINDVRSTVAASDVDTGTITLTAPLGTDADIGDRVFIISSAEIAYDYTIDVHTADGASVEIPLPLPSDRLMWQPGPVIPPVPVTVSDDLTKLLSVPGVVPQVNGASLGIPRAFGTSPASGGIVPHGQTIPNATWTAVGWNGSGSGVDCPTGGATGWVAQVEGLWMMSANVGWTINSTGNRRIRFRYEDPIGSGTYAPTTASRSR